jgi:hypothetical protein
MNGLLTCKSVDRIDKTIALVKIYVNDVLDYKSLEEMIADHQYL